MHRVTQRENIRAARPWLWTALVVAAVVAAAVWAVRPDPAACRSAVTPPPAAPAATPALTTNSPAPDQVSDDERVDPPVSAQARYYTFSPGAACSFPGLPLDGYYVGVPTDEYADSAACGGYADLTGPLGTVRAQIVDRCPGCGPHQYDLSTTAFTRIADPATGIAQITMSRVHNPSPPPDLVYRIADGSSSAWLGLLFTDTGNPLSRVEIRDESGGPGHTLTRGVDDYWSISGAGPGPFALLVTDADGHQAEVPGISIAPGRIQHTGRSLYALPAPSASSPPPVQRPITVTPAPVPCS
jgi:expansin